MIGINIQNMSQKLSNCNAKVFWSASIDKPTAKGGMVLIVNRYFLDKFHYVKVLRTSTPEQPSKGGMDT